MDTSHTLIHYLVSCPDFRVQVQYSHSSDSPCSIAFSYFQALMICDSLTISTSKDQPGLKVSCTAIQQHDQQSSFKGGRAHPQ